MSLVKEKNTEILKHTIGSYCASGFYPLFVFRSLRLATFFSQNTNSGSSINVLASILATESAYNLDPFSSSFNGGISCIWGMQREIVYRWAASLTIATGYGNTIADSLGFSWGCIS